MAFPPCNLIIQNFSQKSNRFGDFFKYIFVDKEGSEGEEMENGEWWRRGRGAFGGIEVGIGIEIGAGVDNNAVEIL